MTTQTPCDREWMLGSGLAPDPDGPVIRVADLFSGCGGMSLGADEALRISGFTVRHVLAADLMESAIDVFARNLDAAEVAQVRDVAELVSGWPGDPLPGRHPLPETDLLLAGPPCQGHSDLNNHTRRSDPRNSLYLKVVRYAEIVRPAAVVIENVPSVALSKEGVVDAAEETFRALGYDVCRFVVNALDLGLPQTRKRLVLVASRVEMTESQLLRWDGERRSKLSDYIADLEDEPDRSDGLFRTPSGMSPTNRDRAEWLLENDEYDLPDFKRPPCHRDKPHSYKSMYGRLRWGQPAQTLTTGFGSMGQGRYLHPSRPRVITPHEAARIQGFPDFFDFSNVTKRTALHTMIGNAVPPRIGGCIVGNLARLGAFGDVATRGESLAG